MKNIYTQSYMRVSVDHILTILKHDMLILCFIIALHWVLQNKFIQLM
jgi:hypothetical protein